MQTAAPQLGCINLLSLGFANTNETQSFLNESINIFMMARSDISVDANAT